MESSSKKTSEMDAASLPAPHTIRTAMRMSRPTVKAKKSLDAQSLLSLLTFHPQETPVGGEAARLPGRKKTVGHAHGHHNSELLEGLANSPYSASKQPWWAAAQDKHKEQTYTNWETDECPLKEEDEDCSSPHVCFQGSETVASAHVKIPWKRPISIRPQAMKVSKSAILSPVRPPFHTRVKVRHPTFHHSAHSQVPKQEALPSALPQPQFLQPVLRLMAIESGDLDDSGEGLEEVLKGLRERKVRTQKPVWTDSHQQNRGYNLRSSYSEETALVLGDTKSLARRRSDRMFIPERLFRHMNSQV